MSRYGGAFSFRRARLLSKTFCIINGNSIYPCFFVSVCNCFCKFICTQNSAIIFMEKLLLLFSVDDVVNECARHVHNIPSARYRASDRKRANIICQAPNAFSKSRLAYGGKPKLRNSKWSIWLNHLQQTCILVTMKTRIDFDNKWHKLYLFADIRIENVNITLALLRKSFKFGFSFFNKNATFSFSAPVNRSNYCLFYVA